MEIPTLAVFHHADHLVDLAEKATTRKAHAMAVHRLLRQMRRLPESVSDSLHRIVRTSQYIEIAYAEPQ